ncbi:translation initiation factor IF-2 N-terminal domain-containing protein [Myxococcota bacterium]|nr:translation initiation factor IF-2 N-terminal domain-containing protein [Myxococcota bacterium]
MSTRIRIYQIAKDLGVDSKDMLEFLQHNGYEKFQSIQKTLDAEEVEAVRQAWLAAHAPKPASSKTTAASAKTTASPTKTSSASANATAAPTKETSSSVKTAPAVVEAPAVETVAEPSRTKKTKKTAEPAVSTAPVVVAPAPVVVAPAPVVVAPAPVVVAPAPVAVAPVPAAVVKTETVAVAHAAPVAAAKTEALTEEAAPKTSARGRKPIKKKAEEAADPSVTSDTTEAATTASPEKEAPTRSVEAPKKAEVAAKEATAPKKAEVAAKEATAPKKAEAAAKEATAPVTKEATASAAKTTPSISSSEEDAFEAPDSEEDEEDEQQIGVASGVLEQAMLRYAVDFVWRCFTSSGFPVRVALGDRRTSGQELLLYSNEIIASLNGDEHALVTELYQNVGYLLAKALRYRFRSGSAIRFIFTPLQEIDISPAAEVQQTTATKPVAAAAPKPEAAAVRQKPEAAAVRQKPEAAVVRQKPEAAVVRQNPEAAVVRQKPEAETPIVPSKPEKLKPLVEERLIPSAQAKHANADHIEEIDEEDEIEEFHADAEGFDVDVEGFVGDESEEEIEGLVEDSSEELDADISEVQEEADERPSAQDTRPRRDAIVDGKPLHDDSSEDARFARISALLAERAQHLGKSILIDMLNSHERRQIHTHIGNSHGKIRTFSDGEGIFRRLVLSPPGITPRQRPSQGRR